MAERNHSWQFVRNQTQQIQGWLSDKENRSLYEAAKKCAGKGVIVEIGSWKGRSTVCLATGSKSNSRTPVYAIDPHTGSPDLQKKDRVTWTYDEFLKNLQRAQVQDLVIPIVDTAENAVANWKLPIELIFIDANYHSYELTRNLILDWQKHVINGGIIALNNVAPSFSAILKNRPLHGLPGPRKAAAEFILQSNNFKGFKLSGCILYAKKCPQNSFKDRLGGRLLEQKINLLYLIHGLYLKSTRLPRPIKTIIKNLMGV